MMVFAGVARVPVGRHRVSGPMMYWLVTVDSLRLVLMGVAMNKGHMGRILDW